MPPARGALWVATAAGLALVARSLLIGPVPLWLSVSALVAYVTLVVVGVTFPRLEVFADVTSHGVAGQHRIALTFDDGPNPRTTRRVLAALGRAGHKATFFVVAAKAERHPDVMTEIRAEGHEIALHGYQHARFYSLWSPRRIESDLARARSVLERTCGVRPSLFRPPVGHVSHLTAAGARRAGVQMVAWSVRALDGLRSADPERVLRRVERGLRDGAIVLLHDAAERDDYEPVTLGVLPRILELVKERGLRGVTVSEILGEGVDDRSVAAAAP
ncbi:MAG: polysaccharide deacetylase family protein [Polyangiaceae bacterium]|nr:polysaccharide deacetylase family protein [Polyangiaceae bacterium]